MKTIEEKSKAYDEAVNKIKPLYEQAKKDGNPIWSTYEYLIPELAESEDERIRKDIVALIKFALEDGSAVSPGSNTTKEEALAYLEKLKEQKPAEKQDYSGLTDFERAIHRGFLCAGVENVPVTIIKETAQECMAKNKPIWSEEDEKILADTIFKLAGFMGNEKNIAWLKSLRPQPHWKPSEEQMKTLERASTNKYLSAKQFDILVSLYEQLKKL